MRRIKRKTLLSLLLIVVAAISFQANPVQAQTPTPASTNPVYVYLFWGEGCPYCAKAKIFFDSILPHYPEVIYQNFEVNYDLDNSQFFVNMAEKYGLENLGVPVIFVGHFYAQGYSEELDPKLIGAIEYCSQNGCIDAAEGVSRTVADTIATLTARPTDTPIPTAFAEETPTPLSLTSSPIPTLETPASAIVDQPPESTSQNGSLIQSQSITLPLIGEIDLAPKSATLVTVLIALVDGFNPCSLWVLSMLIALTLHTGSRKKVFLIGIIFLTVTALIYALFIAGLFTILNIASFTGWVQILVALVALFFALVNIKDYFWFKEGLSLTIADDKKAGIYKRMRSVINASQSFWGLIGATVVLAAGVSLVEFSCTSGFPMIWTNMLNAQHVTGLAFVLLLLLYMLIYQLDELVIFSTAVITLKASRLEEKQGRLLKLVGGMLMLTLSIVMLTNPSLMHNITSSLAIFGLSILATILVLLFHRKILPMFGIKIGTDWNEKKP